MADDLSTVSDKNILKRAKKIQRSIQLPNLKELNGPPASPKARRSFAGVRNVVEPVVLPTRSRSLHDPTHNATIPKVLKKKGQNMREVMAIPSPGPVYSPVLNTFREEDLEAQKQDLQHKRKLQSGAMGLRLSATAPPTVLDRLTMLSSSHPNKRGLQDPAKALRESLKDEERRFHSTSLLCEHRLQRACVATQHLPLPNAQRTLAACELLAEMLTVFGRYDALLLLLAKELFRAIYQEFDLVWDCFQKHLKQREQDKDSVLSLDLILHCGQPYFQMVDVLEAKIEDLKNAGSGNEAARKRLEGQLQSAKGTLDHKIDKWQQVVKVLVFYTWDSFRINQVVVREKFQRMRLRIWFQSWRNKVMRYKFENSEMELYLVNHKHQTELAHQASSVSVGQIERHMKNATAALTSETKAANGTPDMQTLLPPLAYQALLHYRREIMAAVAQGLLPPSVIADGPQDSSAKVVAQLAESHYHSCLDDQMALMEKIQGECSTVLSRIQNLTKADMPKEAGALEGLVEDMSRIVEDMRRGHHTYFQRNVMTETEVQTDAVDIGDLKMDSSRSNLSESGTETNAESKLQLYTQKSKYVIEKFIEEVYLKKIYSDACDDKAHEDRDTFAAFLENLYLTQYGSSYLVSQHMIATKNSVQKYKSKSIRIALFGRICGFVNPELFCEQAGDLIMAIIRDIYDCDLRNIRLHLAEGCGFTFVPFRKLSEVVRKYLPEHSDTFQDVHDLHQTTHKGKKKHHAHSKDEGVFRVVPTDATGFIHFKSQELEELLQTIKSGSKMGNFVKLKNGQTYKEKHEWKEDLPVVDLDRALLLIHEAWVEARQRNKMHLFEEIKKTSVENGFALSFCAFSMMISFFMPGSLSIGQMKRIFNAVATQSDDPKEHGNFFIRSAQNEQLAEIILQKCQVVRREDTTLGEIVKAKLARIQQSATVVGARSHDTSISKLTNLTTATKSIVLIQKMIRGWRARRRALAKIVILRSSYSYRRKLKERVLNMSPSLYKADHKSVEHF